MSCRVCGDEGSCLDCLLVERRLAGDFDSNAKPKRARRSKSVKAESSFEAEQRRPVHSAFMRYRRTAKYRKRDFDLTEEQFAWLVRQPCQYCGLVDWKGINGLDRMDSGAGYVFGNVAPCCYRCNQAKSDDSKEAFLLWIARVITYQTLRGK